MNGLKKIICIFLSVLIFVSATFSVSAYTTDDVVNAALELIFKHEGVYTTVLINDNGAVSIGKIGWHGYRALQLLKTIVNSNKDQAKKILGNSLYNEILTVPDSSWNTRIFTNEEKAVVEKLLATKESQKAQNDLAFSDIKSYVVHGQKMGITDGKALVYFADIENQMGSYGAERVATAAIASAGSAPKVSLKNMYDAAMKDKTASSSPTRRKSAYNYCNALSFGSQGVTSSFEPGQYKITASSLRVRSGPGTSYSQVYYENGSSVTIPNGKKVDVVSISGDWGKVTYNGKTGWISLIYAEYIEVIITPSVTPDINGNGMVDAADARLVLRTSAQLQTLDDSLKKIADVDSDGEITAADARVILRISAQLQ